MTLYLSRRRTRGFTLIEVMMAIGIMTVGAVGLIAMQTATTRGNRNARQMTTATNVTRVWVERVRRDALSWQTNQPAGIVPTQFISNTPPVGDSGWRVPVSTLASENASTDWYGQDTSTDSEKRYCTHIRSRWVVLGQVIRMDVRTVWYKRGDHVVPFESFCTPGAEGSVSVDLLNTVPELHAVYASTIVRWTQPRPI